jgi:hypothetical protein
MMSCYGSLELLRTLGRGNRHTEPHGLMSPRESRYISVCVHEITFHPCVQCSIELGETRERANLV